MGKVFSKKTQNETKRKVKKEEKSFNWTEEDSMSVKKQSEKEEIKKKVCNFYYDHCQSTSRKFSLHCI